MCLYLSSEKHHFSKIHSQNRPKAELRLLSSNVSHYHQANTFCGSVRSLCTWSWVWADFKGSRACSHSFNKLSPLPCACNSSSLYCTFPSLKKRTLLQCLNLVGCAWRLNHVYKVCQRIWAFLETLIIINRRLLCIRIILINNHSFLY